MIGHLPGLLQPWGILAFILIFTAAFVLAYRWHHSNRGRPPIYLDIAAFGLLALLTGGFFWRVLSESGVMMPAGGGDLTSLYFPTYSYVSGQIQSGTIPLWNPFIFSGMPLAADIQTGLFYPFNWVIYLFVQVSRMYGALEWLLIIHYWLASVFTYLFLRDISISRIGALAGGVVFAFCGFMTAHLGHLPMVLVATWIPLLLLLVRRALLRESLVGWAWAVGAGLCIAISIFAGHLQIFAYGLIAAVVMWVFLLLGRKPLTSRVVGIWVAKGALILAIGLGIGSVQLLSSAELSTQSSRDKVSYEEASEFPAQPITLLNLVLPRVYGSSPTTYNFDQNQTTENWGYCGVITLALAAAGVALKRKRMVGFFAIIAVLSFLIMVGDLSIVGAWLYKFVPGFNKLRDSGRALVLLGLGLSGLAAYGLDAVVDALKAGGNRRQGLMWWLVGLSGIIVVVAFGIMPALYNGVLIGNGSLYGRLPGAINDLGMALLWLGLLAGVGWAAYRGRLGAVGVGGAVLALLVLDLFSPNSRFNPTTDNIIAGYQHFDAINLVYKQSQDPRTNLPLRLNSDTDVQDIWQPSTSLLSTLFYDTGGAFNPLKPENYEYVWNIARNSSDSPLYDLTGAGLEVISPTKKHEGQLKWELIDSAKGFEIYRNHNALPRTFMVHEARIEPDRIEGIEVTRRFDVDPRHTVLFPAGENVPSALKGTAEATQEGAGAESVRATSYSANRVELAVKANAPGWVVLTDTWYPGWEAMVDGQSIPIEQAFYTYRAVKVDTGTHTIVMQFRPATWVWGRVVSLVVLGATLVGLISLFVLMRRRRRRVIREA